ncbi:MAG: glycosyl hydrolase [Bacteroidota bacterium]
MKQTFLSGLVLLLALCFCIPANAQRKKKQQKTDATEMKMEKAGYDEALFSSVEWRNLGPHRGGRSAAVTGVPGKPNLYYMGATGGGVWRTKDGGGTWENISDGYFGGSIGAVAVSEYDPNVIYVGGGEVTVRGNVSSGSGVWKSVDAGKTWEFKGLPESRHIPRIRIHPQNPDVVYAAVLGNLYKDTEERGIYKSTDGGDTWKKVLFANEGAGACDLTFDPNNPRILYASTWKIRRTPYSLLSGGEGSGLWKSTDAGETWTNISRNKGLPQDTIGIIGVTVSPVNSNRVWAIIESQTGGVFRSDDGGETWAKLNTSRALRQRAWYYTRIYADTQDEDIVYVMNVRYHKSKDGGKTFKAYNAPHGDHHDLWIAPEDNQRMAIADDGGAQISFDAGENWSTYMNQPTAQYYRVTTDDHFPYRIYVAQQDNSTQRIEHRTDGYYINEQSWESSAGCECGHIAIHPEDQDIVFGGCYDGLLQRLDHKTGLSRSVNVYPDNPMGHGVEGMRYRFQWNFPIFFSEHYPNRLYTASHVLHMSEDQGQTWEVMSPDLTRNDTTKMGSSGGPITKDNTSVEYYCTIFAAEESPRVKDLMWVGSDDGLVHLTRDGGKTWTNVTPKGMPDWILINSLEADPHNDGGAYIAATMYKHGDFQPYLYKTSDYGATWTKIVNGIDEEHFTRVVRADPSKKGLLYAGTENGMYISFDDGANWQSMQLNMPIVPITDLALKNDNLIAATQGRSVWMIDDLTPFHQLSETVAKSDMYLYDPIDAYRMGGGQAPKSRVYGQNHPGGVMTHFYLKEVPADSVEVKLAFLEANGELIQEFSTQAEEEKFKIKDLKAGGNTFRWNMRYPAAEDFKGMVLWWASLNGPQAMPGEYKVRLTVGDESQERDFKIMQDPRSPSTMEDYQEQFTFLMDIRSKISEAHETIAEMRSVREQIDTYIDRLGDDEQFDDIKDMAKDIKKQMKDVEESLYQTKNQSRQDPLNFPIRLTNKLAHLNSLADGEYPPTEAMYEVKREMTQAIDAELAKYQEVRRDMLPKFNQMVKQKAIDAIQLETAAVGS